jgi:hypothetical protein
LTPGTFAFPEGAHHFSEKENPMKFPYAFPIRSGTALAATLALAAGLSGCLSDSESAPTPPADSAPTQNTTEGIYGSMLYAKDLGGDHRVEFYDFGDGNSAIRESGSMDGSAKAVLPSMQISSLEDAYRKLNPQTANIPEAIQKADLAAAAKVWEPGASPKFTTTPEITSPALAKTASQSCSGDAYGDGWGGNWFNSNYCTEGNFRWCHNNSGSAWSGEYSTSWSKWMQMEGDFNLAGHIHATVIRHHWYGDDFRTTLMDHDILPRRWEAWTEGGSDKFSFTATSPCGHAHVNLMWN